MASVTLSMEEYDALKNARRTAEAEVAALRDQLAAARAQDPAGRVQALHALARDALTIIRFSVGNLPPSMIKGWPHATLKAFADAMSDLPDYSSDDESIAMEFRLFAEEARSHEERRARNQNLQSSPDSGTQVSGSSS